MRHLWSVAAAPLLALATAAAAAETPVGYPKPISFRAATPELLPALGSIQMVVSDLLSEDRRGVEEAFKKLHPERTVLVQHDGVDGAWMFLPQQQLEDWGVWPVTAEMTQRVRRLQGFADGLHPVTDFLGYWLYDAGSDSLSAIPAQQRVVTIQVKDTAPFKPNTFGRTVRELKQEVGLSAYPKNIVICPRDATSALDWVRAELATITQVDPQAKTVTVERMGQEGSWHAFAPGAYLAPNSSLMYSLNPLSRTGATPRLAGDKVLRLFHPNLTRFCPRDPRTGLNAAEYLARYYVRMMQQHYPSCDGLVFDVSIGLFYPSKRVSGRVDCDLDGRPDGFFVGHVNHWALGMYDCLYAIRYGVPGKFDGLGETAQLVADVNDNEDGQRFFDIMNGAEFEHAMQGPTIPAGQRFSSSLDTLLLWAERGRKPDRSFVHNKYPDEANHGGDAALLKPPMTLSWYRLDMAAACMGDGYVGKAVSRTAYGAPQALCEYPGRREQRRQYGSELPLDYDEYHAGDRNTLGWLGQPVSAPMRLTTQLGAPVWRFGATTPLPAVAAASQEYRAAAPVRDGDDAVRLTVEAAGLWQAEDDFFRLKAVFPLTRVALKSQQEYSLRLLADGDGPFAGMEPRYHAIPRNLAVRLVVKGQDGQDVPGPYQEFLVFTDARPIALTLTAPADGAGALEISIGEAPGRLQLRDLELRPGCADVMWRLFEHGAVLLNGSVGSPVEFPLETLAAGQHYRRLKGTQEPVTNSGESVGARVTLGPLDGLFLLRE